MNYELKNEKELLDWERELYKKNVRYRVVSNYKDCFDVNESLKFLKDVFIDSKEKYEFYLLHYDKELRTFLIDVKDVEISTNDWSIIDELGEPDPDSDDVIDYFIENFNKFYPEFGSPKNYPKELLFFLMDLVNCYDYYFLDIEYKKSFKEAYEKNYLLIDNVKYKACKLNHLIYKWYDLSEKDNMVRLDLGKNKILGIKKIIDGGFKSPFEQSSFDW